MGAQGFFENGGSQGVHEKGGSQGVHKKGGSHGVHKKGGSREPYEPPPGYGPEVGLSVVRVFGEIKVIG